MADHAAGGEKEKEKDDFEKVTLQISDDITGRKSPSIYRIPIEDIEEIAKKLLDGKFYLTALEFHTELLEAGKEIARFKDFFSNPANFEIQSRLDSSSFIKKTASNLTLDSIDDYARFSDDGFHPNDEKITVLEFELRKARETIHSLRETITVMTSGRKDASTTDLSTNENSENQYEVKTLNFLVNSYLLKHEYKFTSITFSEEIGNQDLDDWDDVGLNAAQPPELLQLLRDYAKHVIDPVTMRQNEMEELKKNIINLTSQCEKLHEDLQHERIDKERLSQELETSVSQRVMTPVKFLRRLDDDDNLSSSSFVSNKSIDSLHKEMSDLAPSPSTITHQRSPKESSSNNTLQDEEESEKLLSEDASLTIETDDNTDNTTLVVDDASITIENDDSDDIRKFTTALINQSESPPPVDDSIENAITKVSATLPQHENTATIEPFDTASNTAITTDNDTNIESDDSSPLTTTTTDDHIDAIPVETEEIVPNDSLVSRQFIKVLFSRVHIKGESRLAHEVSQDTDVIPVDVIAKSLPNIVPNVLLNKREELIPLILCAASYHENSKTRDELLHMLFNLIKRPDQEQRKIIIDGCIAFAKKVGSTRIEAELLPQCWEQINHKFCERRLLVSETCGFVTPYIPTELSGSLIFSMLSQMLQEDRSEEVRSSVVRSLALITAYMKDPNKYSKVYPLLEFGLKDIVEMVVEDVKDAFLPVLGVWASSINKLQSQLIPQMLKLCEETLESWQSGHVTQTSMTSQQGEPNAVLLTSEMYFNNYIDCVIRLVPILFFDCLSSAPFIDEDLNEYETTIKDDRFPLVTNPLYDVQLIMGEETRFNQLVNKFDDSFCTAPATASTGEDEVTWPQLETVCDVCIARTCEMTNFMFNNARFIEKIVCLMCTMSRVFGKNFTQRKIVPMFEKMMRNTGASQNSDVPPVASPLLPVFLCGVFSSFQSEEQAKRLFTFTKQCLVQIATQGLSMEFLKLSITLLCQNNAYQLGLIETLRETIVYPVAQVRAATAVLFEGLIKCVNQQLLSTHVTPAIISLTNDREMIVRISAIPALGTVMEVITEKSVLDKVCLQLQTVLDDPECQKSIPLQKIIIQTFTKILPSLEAKFRDEFVLLRLQMITENNNTVEDLADRLEVAEELITALSSALCCFLPRDVIMHVIIPTLKTLEGDLKDFSPETVDSVLLLQKEAESKCEEDRMSVSSTSSSHTPSKLFSGISSRFKFKRKTTDDRLSGTRPSST